MVIDDQGYTTNQVISIVVNPVDNGAAIISGDNNGVIDEDTSLSGDLDERSRWISRRFLLFHLHRPKPWNIIDPPD